MFLHMGTLRRFQPSSNAPGVKLVPAGKAKEELAGARVAQADAAPRDLRNGPFSPVPMFRKDGSCWDTASIFCLCLRFSRATCDRVKKSLNFIRVTLVSGTQRRRRGEPTRREGEAGWPRLAGNAKWRWLNAKVVPDSDPFATFGDDARHALSYRPVRNAQLSKKDFDGALLCVGQERRLRRFAGSRSGVHKGDKPVASSRCPTNASTVPRKTYGLFVGGNQKKECF